MLVGAGREDEDTAPVFFRRVSYFFSPKLTDHDGDRLDFNERSPLASFCASARPDFALRCPAQRQERVANAFC